MERIIINDFQTALMESLKKARKGRNLSHEKLAELSGVSRQAISKIEAGQRNPTMVTVYRLLKAMDMPLSEFVKNLE